MPANAGQTWKRQFDRQTRLPLSASYKTQQSSYAGPIYIVQSASNYVGAPGSLNISLPKNTTAGNCLVVCSVHYLTTTAANLPTVSIGGTSDNFQLAVNDPEYLSSIFIDPGCVGGQNTVTLNYPGGDTYGGYATVYEVAGLSTSPIDKTTSQDTTPGTTWTSGSTTLTSQQSEICFGSAFVGFGTPGAFTLPGATWVTTTPTQFYSGYYGLAGYQILTGQGQPVFSGATANSIYSYCCAVTLKAANPSANVTGIQQPAPGPAWKKQFRNQKRSYQSPPTTASYKTQISAYTGPIYVVQSATNYTGSGTGASLSVTLPNNTTAGNCLAVCIAGYHGGSSLPTQISFGGSSDNFALAASSSGISCIYTDQSCIGGQNTLSMTFSSGVLSGVWATVYELAGIASSNAVDKTVNGLQSATATWTTGNTSTTSQASEIYIGCLFNGGAGIQTITGPPAPWVNTAMTEFNTPAGYSGGSGYMIATGTGTPAFYGTTTSNTNGSYSTLITLKAANPSANVVGQPTIQPGQTWRRRYHAKKMSINSPNSVPNPSSGGVIRYDDFFLMYG